MAQGPLKSSTLTRKASVSEKSGVSKPKKGARTIAPRKKKLIEQKNLTKKYSSGLIKKTEQSLTEKAGHLELLKGGKKTKKGSIGGSNGGKER